MDMTDKQKQEEKIKSLARFPGENPNPVLRFSMHGQVLMYNNLAGKAIVDFFDVPANSNIHKNWVKLLQDSFAKDNPTQYELQMDERVYMCNIVPIPESYYVNVYATDITAIKEADMALKESEERYKLLVEDASDIIYQTDHNGYFLYANPVALRLMGCTEEELPNLHYLSLIREDHRANATTVYTEQFQKRTPFTYYEFPIVTPEGEEVWIGQNVKLIYKAGWVFGIHAVARDITTRKQVEKELIDAKELAEESMRAKENFLANMSHEMRTPMNAISGMAQLLQKTGLEGKQAEYVNAMERSAGNLLVVLNDILDFSKIESGKLNMESIGLRPKQVVEILMKSMEYLTAEKDIYLNHDIGNCEDLVVLGDPVRINQILVNLVGNAIKFTEKGSVKVSCNNVEEDEDTVSVSYSVQDTGMGISSEKLVDIFQEFYQADDSTTRKFGGTGLGLAISKKLVEMQGGKLSVESEEGVGSVFSFTINYKKGTEKDIPVAEELNIDEHELSGTHVLLVEDHELNKMMARTLLEDAGMVVDTADNGKIAVDMLQNNTYDVVLMDVQMPVMGGIEATKVIRNELNIDVPVIALTANALKGDKEKYMAAGMNDYLPKPFKANELKAKIAHLTGKGEPVLDENQLNGTDMDSNSTEKLYDLTFLEESANGNMGFVAKMIEGFLEHTPVSLENISGHLQNNEWDRVRAVAHKMKPSLDFMGLKSLKADIRLIEQYADEEVNLNELPDLIQKLNQVCEQAMAQLREELVNFQAE